MSVLGRRDGGIWIGIARLIDQTHTHTPPSTLGSAHRRVSRAVAEGAPHRRAHSRSLPPTWVFFCAQSGLLKNGARLVANEENASKVRAPTGAEAFQWTHASASKNKVTHLRRRRRWRFFPSRQL
jgi:hypothetical protein